MALTFILSFLIDSKWASFGIGIGQLIGAGVVWILYSREVNKIEKLNDEIEDL